MHAPAEKIGMEGKCRKCSTIVVVPPQSIRADGGSSSPTNTDSGRSGAPLSERMRANRVVAGKMCKSCNLEIELGDPVVNCQKCGYSSHAHCYDNCGCPNPGCHVPKTPPLIVPEVDPVMFTSLDSPKTGEPVNVGGSTVACPYCGEAILSTARKCRFCNEFLDEDLRSEKGARANSDDDDMSGGDIVFCILCSGIACIFGLVYAIQGKKKGWKMMGLSLMMNFFWTFVQAVLTA